MKKKILIINLLFFIKNNYNKILNYEKKKNS